METDGETCAIEEIRTEIPHIKQKYSWDCGLACSKMVLSMLKKDTTDLSSICSNLGIQHSVWTIDLASIMKHYEVGYLMCTITFGVDKGYSSKAFYREKFNDDELRVNSLFGEDNSKEMHLEKRSVALDEILDHLSHGNVLIALVDWSRLKCIFCDSKCLPTFVCVGQCLSRGYQGHFVVVCGYNRAKGAVFYKNPSCEEELCCCTFDVFDTARKSYGTDEDLLFIYSNY